MKKLIILLVLTLFITSLPVFTLETFQKEVSNSGSTHVKHTHSENAYQHAWCSANGGVEEVKNADLRGLIVLRKHMLSSLILQTNGQKVSDRRFIMD